MAGLTFKHDCTAPRGLSVEYKDGLVIVGDYKIALSDFFDAVEHVLTGTYLQGAEDPRKKFFFNLRNTHVLENFVKGKDKLVNDGPPSCP